MSPEEELIRAGDAQRMLDNPMFMEASKRVLDGLASQRRQVPMRDTEMHTRLIIAEQLWANIEDWLKQTAETGKFAEFTLRQRETAKRGLFGALK